MIYFDAAATTFEKPPEVAEAVLAAMHRCASPSRGGYAAALAADETVFACRQAAAELFDAEAEQVVFTMNATHGLNIAIHSLIQSGDRVLVSGFEHNAVMRPLTQMQADVQVIASPLFDDTAFLFRLDAALRQPCAAVVCTHVSNVFGWRLPIEQVASLCRRRGVPLIIDASQSAGCLPVSLRKTGAAFIAMPGHKGLYGPPGTGILLCGQIGQPLLCGGTGSQSAQLLMPEFLPDRHEAGTANVCGIAGLLAGIRFVQRIGTDHILRHEQALCRKAAQVFCCHPGVRVFQGPAMRQTGVLSFVCRLDSETMAQNLAEHEICVRAGLHCAPIAHRTVGTEETGTVRLSFGVQNHPQQIQEFANVLDTILK